MQHPQLIEAQKQLDAAKDTYFRSLASIEGQHLKRLAGAGLELEGVAQVRAQYPIEAQQIPAPAEPGEPDAPQAAATPAPKRRGGKKKASK